MAVIGSPLDRLNAAFALPCDPKHPSQRLMLAYVAWRGRCHASVETIARETGLSKSGVRLALAALTRNGSLLLIDKRGHRQTDIYEVCMFTECADRPLSEPKRPLSDTQPGFEPGLEQTPQTPQGGRGDVSQPTESINEERHRPGRQPERGKRRRISEAERVAIEVREHFGQQ